MDTKIDKNVPMPAYMRAVTKYPFSAMEVGDSFFVTTDRPGLNSLRSRASTAGHRSQAKYSVRKVENGARVWRVE
jgi:uncharacterized protein (DUF2249 family)